MMLLRWFPRLIYRSPRWPRIRIEESWLQRPPRGTLRSEPTLIGEPGSLVPVLRRERLNGGARTEYTSDQVKRRWTGTPVGSLSGDVAWSCSPRQRLRCSLVSPRARCRREDIVGDDARRNNQPVAGQRTVVELRVAW